MLKDGFYLLFPVVELPARSVPIAQICLGADIGTAKALSELLAFIINSFALLVGRLRSDATRHYNDLDTSYPWRKDKPFIITVDHDHNTNGSGRQTPGILPNVDLAFADRVVRVLYEDIKHIRIGEVGSKAVRGGALNTTTRGGDETFDSGCVEATSKFLLFGLDTGNDRNRKQFLVYTAVEVKDLQDFSVRLFTRKVSGMAFLPEELSGPKERFCG